MGTKIKIPEDHIYPERLAKMKGIKLFVLVGLLLSVTASAWALKGITATADQVEELKADLRDGKIKVGATRLKDFQSNYGEAASITDTDKKISYDYGGVKIDLEKKKYLKEWSYDSFKQAVYTKAIDNLRYDLERKELVGDNITFDKIRKDYGEPTESLDSFEDGSLATFYYGDIKLVFENVFSVRSWSGQKLDTASTTSPEKISTSSKPPAPVAATPPGKESTPTAKPGEKTAEKKK